MRIKIIELHEEDAHYPEKEKHIGITGEFSEEDFGHGIPGYKSGELTLDVPKGETHRYYYAIKFEVCT